MGDLFDPAGEMSFWAHTVWRRLARPLAGGRAGIAPALTARPICPSGPRPDIVHGGIDTW